MAFWSYVTFSMLSDVMGFIHPEIVAHEGTEPVHPAVMHLFQASHVPMGDDENDTR